MNAPMPQTLTSAIDASLRAAGSAILIETAERRVTAAEVDREAARCAGGLSALGVVKGDRVAVQIEKSVEMVFLYLACLRLGAIYLPLNTAYRRTEIEYFLSDSEPRLFVCPPDRSVEYQPLADKAGTQLLTLGEAADGTLPTRFTDAASAPATTLIAEDIAAIVYTSGTTGRSKGAMLTHRNLLSNARALAKIWGITSKDVLLHALPIFHIHGLFVALNTSLLTASKMLFVPKFDAATVLSLLPRATVFMGVPTYYTRLLDEAGLNRASVANIRLFVSGSAPLSTETFATFEERTGHRILERYGMTETGIITSNPLAGPRIPGTVGVPLPETQVRIADDTGKPLPPDQPGMVEVRGPGVFGSYWRLPEKTAAEFRADRFFITGDVGQMDASGVLRLVGRAKDLIICGGLNVYPKEIEELIDAVAGVRECAVIGLPHPDFGEAVAAVVDGISGQAPSEDEIIGRLKGAIANFKVPKAVFFVEQLPRNAMGKVQKNVLRERFAARFMAQAESP